VHLKVIPRINGTLLARLGLELERTRPTHRETRQTRASWVPPAIEEVDDVAYRTGEWSYTAPMSHIVGRPIFGYGPDSWHPFVAACRELLDTVELTYTNSVLHRFYATFAPESIADAYHLSRPGPLDGIPAASLFEAWVLSPPPFDDPFASVYPSGSPLFGPQNSDEGEAEWRRLRHSVESVLRYGYRPDLFPRGRINVTILRSQGDQRYLVGHGQHRTAVLAAMGESRVEVGIHAMMAPIVDESEVESWPHVRSGLLKSEEAVPLLRRYFTTPENDPALTIGAACDGLGDPAASG
jgi:hypothetical protein